MARPERYVEGRGGWARGGGRGADSGPVRRPAMAGVVASAARAAGRGVPHGAEGVCVTPGGDIVIISPDGVIWDLPAGRPESGRVLVRSVWRAEVELRPWEARFEIADRRVVAPAAVADALSLGSHPFAAIIRRELAEAALTT